MPQVYGGQAWVADLSANTITAASNIDMTMDLRTSRAPTSFKGLPKTSETTTTNSYASTRSQWFEDLR